MAYWCPCHCLVASPKPVGPTSYMHRRSRSFSKPWEVDMNTEHTQPRQPMWPYINTFPAPRTEEKFLPASGDQVQAGLAGRDLGALGETHTSWGCPPSCGSQQEWVRGTNTNQV